MVAKRRQQLKEVRVRHFDQPIESAKMEAIKMLIEQEAKKQKTSAIQKKAAVAPAMEA